MRRIITCLVGNKPVEVEVVKENRYTVWVRVWGRVIKRHKRKHLVGKLEVSDE